ncbi:NfeD family protein [Flavimobilis sp. GY10621]|uniref:NfeD family protein n=1 Tax=Flavimobilis rhizosphaerae TaxID=2775421 RepID=A0ABR9DRS2_9MICO|nr:NfeD family protein [Flavimobilis rhizosphaerae]MBD9699816.1 NfeD family protein [Flavimobilis rhizosphaerae]
MDWYWWVAIMLALVAIEAMTLDLVLFMFAGGALGAAVVAAADGDLVWQVVVFAIVSTILLAALRPFMLKSLRKRGENLPETNAAALVGRDAIVVDDVSEHAGLVKLAGEVWSARTEGDAVIAAGTEVRVVRIAGAIAIVTYSDHPASA